jgi:hypothetical protein
MILKNISANWPKTFSLLVLTALLFWGYGCPAKTVSLLDPQQRVTRPELQIELDTLIASAEYRMAELEKQDRFRDLIFDNALVMVESGSLNPAGILTLLAGLYGVAHGVKDIKNRLKPKPSDS